jgi:hypothetical protein
VRRALPVLAALTVSLAVAAPSGAAVKSGVDRHGGMRLTLAGRVLTVAIVHPRARNEVFGRRVVAVCSPLFLPRRRDVVVVRAVWPDGARRVRFRFGRDVSARAKWCVLEHRGGEDIAAVGFIRREPPRFVAKGRGPAGDWWRLAGWRSWLGEPCALLRSRRWGARACFERFADHPITLAAEKLAPCDQDVIVFGVVSSAAATVRVSTRDGASADATLYERPARSRVRGRYFVATLPEHAEPTTVESLDAEGRSLETADVADGGTVCT